ncbi:Swt1 family HEPN domain-containing protein [uncultured Tateyamaria sp.]|uniref:Swt1 family HEPN domain-containing protein n=1 Tax=uncultured Tateyamaria sp. TaxID=455651 RepID=UPI00261DB972|nr:Swt1 family HEPN domain-containing protein [uncultured Tateyamaria sp.]
MTDRALLDKVRAFGMSGFQIRDDISKVEKEKTLNLLVRPRAEKVRKLEGYDQFEGRVRADAAQMSEFYEIFYCLEVSIRQLVENILEEAEGADWWNSERVEKEFREYVQRIQSDEANTEITTRSERNIDYLTFGQLGKLITNNFDVFNAVLSSKRAVDRIMSQLNLLRNPIAHCGLLADDEKERLELTVRDWFRMRS